MNKGIRCHFSSIFSNTIRTVWALILIVLFNVSDEIVKMQEEGYKPTHMLIAICIFMGLILLTLFYYFLRWRKTYIYIEDDNFVVDCDFFINKRKKTVKLSSIATVNFQQGILEHLFKTYKLQIDIDSSATANKTDFNLTFSQDIAVELKKKLTQNFSKDEGESNYSEIEREELTPIFEFPTQRVIKHGLLSISVGGVLFSIAMLIFTLYTQYSDTTESKGSGINIATILGVLLVVGPVLVESVSPFIRYQNFKIGKRCDRLVVSYGLITNRQYNLPLSKTNAVVIKQPFLARLCHLYYGEIINVGMGDEEENKQPIFCLLVNKEEMELILNEINPNFVINDIGEKSPKLAFIPILVPYLIFGIVSVVIASLLHYWWVGVIILAFLILTSYVSYRTKALSILEDKAIITTGVFMRRSIVVPFSKIQNIVAKNGPISRHFGISKGDANILASLTNMSNDIGYFQNDRFDKLFEKMLKYDSVTPIR